MTYARARLWLGICGVGLIVGLASLALVYSWPNLLFGHWPSSFLSQALALAYIVAGYSILHVPLDYIGGYWLPCYHSRQCLLFNIWAAQYLRASLSQAAILWVSSVAVLAAGRYAGRPGALLVLALWMLLLIEGQDFLARFLAGLQREVRNGIQFFGGMDSGFSGGLAGLPGRERIVLPALWTRILPPAATEFLTTRRQASLASRRLGLALAIVFNLSGFWLCSHLPNAGVSNVSELFTTALGFTLWSFLGLLLLPSLSRPAVYQVDQSLRLRNFPADRFETLLREIDHLQDDEPERSGAIETVFHPIPSLDRRLQNFQRPAPAFGAWNTARYALYLSWPCLGFLNRAVHCNAGRPELWVMLPVD